MAVDARRRQMRRGEVMTEADGDDCLNKRASDSLTFIRGDIPRAREKNKAKSSRSCR
jgi:hypothetical protein